MHENNIEEYKLSGEEWLCLRGGIIQGSFSFNKFVLFEYLYNYFCIENIIKICFLQNEENLIIQERTASICTEFSLAVLINIPNLYEGLNTLDLY